MPDPGPRMRQQHHRGDRRPALVRAQPAGEGRDRLLDLLARRPALPVPHRQPRAARVAVLVDLLGRPLVAPDIDPDAPELLLDREQAARAEEKGVDLTAGVTVAPHQEPLVVQCRRELVGHPALGVPSRQDRLFARRGQGGDQVLPRSLALRAGHGEDEPQPGEPPALRARLAPLRAQRLNLCQPIDRAAPPLPLHVSEHEVRMLGQDLNAHAPPAKYLPCLNVTHRI